MPTSDHRPTGRPSRVPSHRLGRRFRLAAIAVMALALLSTSFSSAQADGYDMPDPGRAELHVMSFNLHFASASRPNQWPQRRPVTKRLLELQRPHIIGTQEGLFQQLKDIEADQGGRYRGIGMGRDGDSRGEQMMVFYDWRRLEPMQYKHYWLSDTPEVLGSKTWDGCCPRMVTWVRFKDKVTGKQFYFLNTHLEAYSGTTRRKEARLILDRMKTDFWRKIPVLMTGDFNTRAAQGVAVYDMLVTNGPMADTWVTARQRGPQWGTFNNYRPPVRNGSRIDWLLSSPSVVTRAAQISTFKLDNQYPSDHLPVQAIIRLP